MDKIFSYITKNFISVLGITILTGTTLTTSALGVMKVANNFEKTKLEVPEVKGVETSLSSEISPTPSTGNQTTGNSRIIPHPKGTSTAQTNQGVLTIDPTLPPLTSSTTTQANTSTSQCVITLFSNKYVVTSLRTTHSGGNIFNCGTDMTAVYQGRHGTSLSRMQKYLISTTSSSGGTTSSGNTTSGSNTSSSANTTAGNTTNTNNTNGGGNNSNNVPPNTNNTGGSSGTTSTSEKAPEIYKEENHKDEERSNKDEDHKEEEETHLESFFNTLLRLVVS